MLQNAYSKALNPLYVKGFSAFLTLEVYVFLFKNRMFILLHLVGLLIKFSSLCNGKDSQKNIILCRICRILVNSPENSHQNRIFVVYFF